MKKYCVMLTALLMAQAHGFTLNIDSGDLNPSPEFSNVTTFRFTLDIDAAFETGEFLDPTLRSVDYEVSGTLAAGTPSGFEAFELVRAIRGCG